MSILSKTGLSVSVTWSGQDDLSGIRHYDVQVKEGAGVNWTPWLSQTTQTQSQFIGTKGYSYTFRIRATDNVSNTAQTWQESQPVTINAVTKYYTHGGARVAMRQGDVVYYLHGDHLGSTSLTTDQDQNIVSEVRYLPYGEERWTNGASPTDFGFTAQRHEAGFGLMDYNARYYSTRLGRFVSPDTVVPEPTKSQGLNRYGYANSNPIHYTDPTGHCLEDLCIVEGTIAVSLIVMYSPQIIEMANETGALMAIYGPQVVSMMQSAAEQGVQFAQQMDAAGRQPNGSDGGNFGSLDPKDPRFQETVEELTKEHNQSGYFSKETMKAMLEDINKRTGVSDINYGGPGGKGADLRNLGIDFYSFQKGAGTAEQFGRNLYSALVEKSGQLNTSTLYVQLNTGLGYDVQNTLNETMAAWAQEGTKMLNSVYIYNAQGQQLAEWIAGGH